MSPRFNNLRRCHPLVIELRNLVWIIPLGAFGAMVFAVAYFLSVAHVGAHEAMSGWKYPWECCSNLDCAEISSDRVKPEGGGYVIDGKFHVTQSAVKHSPDGRYHACFPNPHTLRCFFAPPMGF